MQNNRNWWVGGIVLVAVLLAGGIYGLNRDRSAEEAKKSGGNEEMASLLDSVDLRSFADKGGLITAKASADLSDKLGVVDSKVAFGDLTGDGKEDAAIAVEEKSGNSTFISLVVMQNNDGQASYLDGMYLGDRIQIESLEIADGVITVKYLSHRTNDFLSAPTLERIESFRLAGERLVSA